MTRCSAHPLRRVVISEHDGPLVVELRDRTVTIRRRRGRASGPSAVVMTWGQLYLHGIVAKLEDARRVRAKARRRRKGVR